MLLIPILVIYSHFLCKKNEPLLINFSPFFGQVKAMDKKNTQRNILISIQQKLS